MLGTQIGAGSLTGSLARLPWFNEGLLPRMLHVSLRLLDHRAGRAATRRDHFRRLPV
jgi:hypothetical protein